MVYGPQLKRMVLVDLPGIISVSGTPYKRDILDFVDSSMKQTRYIYVYMLV